MNDIEFTIYNSKVHKLQIYNKNPEKAAMRIEAAFMLADLIWSKLRERGGIVISVDSVKPFVLEQSHTVKSGVDLADTLQSSRDHV